MVKSIPSCYTEGYPIDHPEKYADLTETKGGVWLQGLRRALWAACHLPTLESTPAGDYLWYMS